MDNNEDFPEFTEEQEDPRTNASHHSNEQQQSNNPYNPFDIPMLIFRKSKGLQRLPRNIINFIPISAAPICCNCCRFTYGGCAKFWAVFNLFQTFMSFVEIFVRHYLWKFAKPEKHWTPVCKEMSRGLLSGTPNNNLKLAIEVILLLIYTSGSTFFTTAVFHKTLDPNKRVLFLLIYIIATAFLQLAYLIPLIIDYSLCVKTGFLNLVLSGAWYMNIMAISTLGGHIAWVLRKWVIGKLITVTPTTSSELHQKDEETV